MFKAAPGAIASAENLFDCVYAPNSSERREVVDVLDTVEAADNAKTACDANLEETTEDQADAIGTLVATTGLKSETLDDVVEVERIESEIPPEDLEQIEEELAGVEEAAGEAEEAAAELFKATRGCFKAMEETKKERKRGRKLEKEAKEWEKKEKEARGGGERERCRREKDRTRGLRKEACKRAGLAARRGRDFKKECKVKKEKVKVARARAEVKARNTKTMCGNARRRAGKRRIA